MARKNLYVAVVDDDDSFSGALGRRLRAAGFEPIVYSSAEALLRDCNQVPIDCLVLDIHLGGMSGLDLRRQLTSMGKTIPVIFVTAHDEPEIRDEAREVGCSAYFRKPVAGKDLVEAILRAVAKPITGGSKDT